MFSVSEFACVTVNGKTGQRRIPIVRSSEFLRKWLDVHPLKDNPDSLVWIKFAERKGNFKK